MISTEDNPLVGRIGALAILLGVVVVLSPVLTAPISRYVEARAALGVEEAVLAKAETRLATVESLAGRAPIVNATNREEAMSAMLQVINAAANPADMRILALDGGTASEPEAKRMDVSVMAEANPAGLAAFAKALAAGSPVLSVTRLSVGSQSVPGPQDQGQPVRLGVQMVITGFFAKGASQ